MVLSGIAASEGIAIAKAYVLVEDEIKVDEKPILKENIPEAHRKIDASLAEALLEIEAVQKDAFDKLGEEHAAIFEAHSMLLSDPEYIEGIKTMVSQELCSPSFAVKAVTDRFIEMFEAIDDPYLRERAADLRDVSSRFLRKILRLRSASISDITDQCIIIAKDLTPSDTARLDRSRVLGFAAALGGYTSHSAIMARTMSLPAVVGLGGKIDTISSGDMVIIDGFAGEAIVNPDERTLSRYEKKKREWQQQNEDLLKLVNSKTVTRDGKQVMLAANIGNPSDAKTALENGAEGVGLYRTEFLFLGKDTLPSEDEQFEAYKAVAEIFGEKPVIIRTLDVGGDKELPRLNLPSEMNPFLGYRAIRLCLDKKDLFHVQLRALLRASAFGNIKIMFPMIALLEEFRKARKALQDAMEELRAVNIPFDEEIETGMMIEIPAAAVIADKFAKEADFFSIGTNDLIQYTMAADRMNEKVSYLYQPFNPAVLCLIDNVIKAGHRNGKHVGMCGEMAGNKIALPILLGMGLDEFSMSGGAVLPVRAVMATLDMEKARLAAEKVLEMGDSNEIIDFIKREFSL